MKLSATSRKILEWVGNIIAVICALLLIWGIISFVDVNMHNGFGGYRTFRLEYVQNFGRLE